MFTMGGNTVLSKMLAVSMSNAFPILVGTLAQYAFAVLWFSVLCSSIFAYYLAVDKGVKKMEHIRFCYPLPLCCVTSFVASLLRTASCAFVAAAYPQESQTLAQYHFIGLLVFLISMIGEHRNMWAQRPLPLLMCYAGFELGAALLASSALYYFS